jgi:hypothetical protein
MIANAVVKTDGQLRLTSNTTLQGAAQAKGSATDLMLVIVAAGDGANPVAGTVTHTIQGGNTSTGPWTTVVADKGTIANTTVAGQQVLHFAQLQYAYYRDALSAAASTTADHTLVWAFQGVADSSSNSVQ